MLVSYQKMQRGNTGDSTAHQCKFSRVIFCVFLTLCVSLSWGQTWNLTPTMTATLSQAGVLTISTTATSEAMPSTMDPPVMSNLYWYADGKENDILSVVIEDKVTTIGGGMFLGCTNLASVTIPNSVTGIGFSAFQGCKITSLTIPKSVTNIGPAALLLCPLSDVTVSWDTPLNIAPGGVGMNPVFLTTTVASATLHVPAGTQSAYEADPWWGAFGTIVESGGGGNIGDPPTCTLSGVTNITAHSATLNGSVNPNGSNTAYSFQYATNIAFPTNSTTTTGPVVIGSGTSAVPVSVDISPLSENSHYYYRIIAYNVNGDVTTNHTTFDTPFDIQLSAAMNIPAGMSAGQSYPVSIKVLNNSNDQFNGCFYLKDGNTDVLDWYNITINSSKEYTLEKTYTPTTSGSKTLTLYHQVGCDNSGTKVEAGNYSNPITVTVGSVVPTLSVSRSELSFAASGGQETFTVTSNTNWIVSSNENWATISPASGSNNGTVTVTTAVNTTTSQRTATITVSGTGVTARTVNITQAAATSTPYLTVTPSGTTQNPVYIAGDNGTTKSFTVSSNVEWIAEITNSSAFSWLSVTKNSNTAFTIRVLNANNTGARRRAGVTISGTGVSHTVHIEQEALFQGMFSVSPKGSINVDAKTGSGSIQVASDLSWDVSVTSTGNWLRVNKTKGSGNEIITYSYDANNGSERKGTIRVVSSNLDYYYLDINQLGVSIAPYLILPVNEARISGGSGSGSFKVSSNIAWTVTVVCDDNWLSLTTNPNGQNDGNVGYTINKSNPYSTDRRATFYIRGGGLECRYYVIQAGSSAGQTQSYQLRQRFPQNGATDMPRSTPKFDWEDSWVSNPRYELQIMGTLQGTISRTVSSSEYQFDPSKDGSLFEYNKTYRWRVREVSTTSPRCDWSEERSFTVSAAPPTTTQSECRAILGHFNNAIIRKNSNNCPDPGLLLQCVRYVRLYNEQVYGLKMYTFGDAKYYYGETQRLGFAQFKNGESDLPPKIGDILCFEGGEWGHVGIIREVGPNYVNIAQQNMKDNDNYISQRTGLTVSNGKYSITNYLSGLGLILKGWRRAQPTVLSPLQHQNYNTTDVVIKWLEHPAVTNYQVQISTYNTQTKMYEGLAADYYGKTPSFIFKGEANKQYRCRVHIYTCNGHVETEPVYFSIGNVLTRSESIDENSTRLRIKTLKQTNAGIIVATNIRVDEIYEGYYLNKGETNEEGFLNVEIAPALKSGDILAVSGPGVMPKNLEITDAMLKTGEAQVVLQENVSDNSIIDAKVEILNYQPFYTGREVKLKITAKNHNSFQIIDYQHSSDSLSASTEYEPADSLVSFILYDVGENPLSVRFLGENDVWISKTLVFNPETANIDMATVTVQADDNSLGSKIYLNGSYLKQISRTTEVVQVPLGFQNFTFVKEDYATVFVTTNGDETIDLRMTATGIEPVKVNDMTVDIYPNPVNDEFVLSINNAENEKIVVSIYNAMGVKVEERTISDRTAVFNISSYQPGVYFVRLASESGKSETKKLVKK